MTARGAVSRQSGSPPRCHSGCQKERGRAGGAGRWEQALKGGLAAAPSFSSPQSPQPSAGVTRVRGIQRNKGNHPCLLKILWHLGFLLCGLFADDFVCYQFCKALIKSLHAEASSCLHRRIDLRHLVLPDEITDTRGT